MFHMFQYVFHIFAIAFKIIFICLQTLQFVCTYVAYIVIVILRMSSCPTEKIYTYILYIVHVFDTSLIVYIYIYIYNNAELYKAEYKMHDVFKVRNTLSDGVLWGPEPVPGPGNWHGAAFRVFDVCVIY